MAEAKEDEEEAKAHRPLCGSEAEQTLGSLLPSPPYTQARTRSHLQHSSRPVTPPNCC